MHARRMGLLATLITLACSLTLLVFVVPPMVGLAQDAFTATPDQPVIVTEEANAPAPEGEQQVQQQTEEAPAPEGENPEGGEQPAESTAVPPAATQETVATEEAPATATLEQATEAPLPSATPTVEVQALGAQVQTVISVQVTGECLSDNTAEFRIKNTSSVPATITWSMDVNGTVVLSDTGTFGAGSSIIVSWSAPGQPVRVAADSGSAHSEVTLNCGGTQPTATLTPTNTPEPTATHTPTATATSSVPCAGEGRPDCSSVSVSGYCSQDGVASFVITNTGEPGNGDMAFASEYRIYVDNVLVYTGSFQLLGGQSITIQWPAPSGSNVRLEADQQPGHPGNSHPNASVTCETATTTPSPSPTATATATSTATATPSPTNTPIPHCAAGWNTSGNVCWRWFNAGHPTSTVWAYAKTGTADVSLASYWYTGSAPYPLITADNRTLNQTPVQLSVSVQCIGQKVAFMHGSAPSGFTPGSTPAIRWAFVPQPYGCQPTATPTSTLTATPTSTLTATPTSTPVITDVPPTATPLPSATSTATSQPGTCGCTIHNRQIVELLENPQGQYSAEWRVRCTVDYFIDEWQTALVSGEITEADATANPFLRPYVGQHGIREDYIPLNGVDNVRLNNGYWVARDSNGNPYTIENVPLATLFNQGSNVLVVRGMLEGQVGLMINEQYGASGALAQFVINKLLSEIPAAEMERHVNEALPAPLVGEGCFDPTIRFYSDMMSGATNGTYRSQIWATMRIDRDWTYFIELVSKTDDAILNGGGIYREDVFFGTPYPIYWGATRPLATNDNGYVFARDMMEVGYTTDIWSAAMPALLTATLPDGSDVLSYNEETGFSGILSFIVSGSATETMMVGLQ